MRQLLRRVWYLIRRRRFDEDLREELEFHRAAIERDLEVGGMAAGDARLASRRAFGSAALTQDQSRDTWLPHWLQGMGQDVRHAIRTLRCSPAFSSTVVLVLALGIGANAAIFSVVKAVLLRPLPYADGSRIAWIWSTDEKNGVTQWVSYPDFLDWRAQSQAFKELVGWGSLKPVLAASGVEDAEQLQAAVYVGDLFALLGRAPLVGTLPSAAAGAPRQLVVVSHELWRRRFGSNPQLPGTDVVLDGQPVTIAAVMPADFRFPLQGPVVDLWMPLPRFNPALARRRDARLIEVVGRLQPGATLASAQAELDVTASNLGQEYPATNSGIGVRVVSAQQQITGPVSKPLWLLFAAVGVLLAIACVNIASLLLGRALARQQELAVRATLGASRARVAMHLLVETLVLWSVGGVLSVLVAEAGVRVLARMVPTDFPRAGDVRVDVGVAAFLAAVSFLTAMTVGFLPAWSASRVNLVTTLQQTGPTTTDSRRRRRWASLLVFAEIALAMLLVVEAGLFMKSFLRLAEPIPGFHPDKVLTFEVSWPSPQFSPERAVRAFQELQERLRLIPGVVAASVGVQLPDRGLPLLSDVLPFVEVEGHPIPASDRRRTAFLPIQHGFFDVMGIPLVAGRDVSDEEGPLVAVVNQSLAHDYFGQESPVGRRLILEAWTFFGRRTVTIVGVAGDLKRGGPGAEAQPMVYVPLTQYPKNTSTMVIRTAGDPTELARSVSAAVASVEREQPIHNMRTLDQLVNESAAQERFTAILLVGFALVASALAASGLYGVVSQGVAQRTHELGVRLALGAGYDDALVLVVRDGIQLAAAGVTAGVAGVFALTRIVRSLLFDVAPTDAVTLVSLALTLTLIASLACWLPARRIAKIDPLQALRYQ